MALIALGKCLPEGLGTDWTMELFDEPQHGLAPTVGRTPSSVLSSANKDERGRPSYDTRDDQPIVFSGRSATAEKAIAELQAATPMVQALRRGVRWLKSMQSKDGGWGAFDADNTREVLTKVPFADHNAMIDPSTSDITARVLESFAGLGISPDSDIHQRRPHDS